MALTPLAGDVYDHILLPTEATAESSPVVDLAVDLADRWGAALFVLYVVEDTEGLIADLPLDERRDRLTADQEAAFEDVEAATRGLDVPVQTGVGTGQPEHSIPRHVDRVGADFVVMGTHGRTGVERLLVGSTAEKVIRRADVPVLVVPLNHDD